MIGQHKPIRVCLITHRWGSSFSGAAHRFRQYIPGFRELGIELDVLCSTAPTAQSPDGVSGWEDLEFGEISEADESEGAHVYRVRLPPRPSLHRNMLLRRAMVRHLRRNRADVAQFLTLEPLRTYGEPGLAATGIKGVFTGTQLWTFSDNTVKRFLQRRWIRFPVQKLDHLVVSSIRMRDYFVSIGITLPMSVIPNGVNLERFRSSNRSAAKSSARDELGIPADADVIVFIGSIIHRKGVDVLLEAFARVAAANARAELVLVGPRDDRRTTEVRAFDTLIDELVSRSGVANRIHFAGYASNVETYLRAADVFVLPSRREGMGNVVLEAMAAGVPTVVAPYLGLPKEFGEPGTHYVLSPPDADSMASKIGCLLEDHDRREALGVAGRHWVEEHMDMSLVVDAYARIYRDLALYGAVRPRNGALSCIG